jgi:hypothetical protein
VPSLHPQPVLSLTNTDPTVCDGLILLGDSLNGKTFVVEQLINVVDEGFFGTLLYIPETGTS